MTKKEPTSHVPDDCQQLLRQKGKTYPRTCSVCKLGPCPYFTNEGKVIAPRRTKRKSYGWD